ncbi:MAG: GNAT family N-acetyltransferase, partial [Gallionellaceae bacterium]
MSWDGPPPPYRIETERLVIRCYETDDAALLKEAIDSSLEHLREWMPWADAEPQTLGEKTELIESFRAVWAAGENFVYGIFSADESRLLGGSGLHPRVGPGGLEIGY